MRSYSKCPCRLDTSTSTVKCPEGSLRHAQEKEEYLIDRYSDLLAVYEAQYLAIGQALMASEKFGFEDHVLQGLMATLRTAMSENERHLQAARTQLWNSHEAGLASEEEETS